MRTHIYKYAWWYEAFSSYFLEAYTLVHWYEDTYTYEWTNIHVCGSIYTSADTYWTHTRMRTHIHV